MTTAQRVALDTLRAAVNTSLGEVFTEEIPGGPGEEPLLFARVTFPVEGGLGAVVEHTVLFDRDGSRL